jgi:hypothetical protein
MTGRYYQFWTTEIGKAGGYVSMEVDWSDGLVIRQVTAADGAFRWGEWNGSALVGDICDQHPSGLSLRNDEEIASEDFELAWRLARG